MGLLINGQVGWRTAAVIGAPAAASTLWTSVYGVWNADATISASLDTNILRVYNGDNVNDTSGNAQNGTNVNNVTFTTGKVGNAFTFNGTNNVLLPTNSLNSLTGDFSISSWVYLPATYLGTGGATVYILWNVTAPTWANNLKGITLRITSNTIVGFTIYDGVTSASVSFNDSASTYLKNSGWVHITATRKASTGSKLYLNGNLVASNTSAINPVYSPTFQTPNIGNLRTTNSSGTVLINNDFAFNGSKIDGLTIWDKELTASEVTDLYNVGDGVEYPFSGKTIGSLNDAVGTNNGTRPASTLTGGVPGPSFTAGKIGKAFTFDGINDYVNLGNNIFNSFTSDFSISGWINLNSVSGNRMVMANQSYNNSTGRSNGWGLIMRGNTLVLEFYTNTSPSIYSQLISSPLSTSTWIHVVVTRKASTRSRMYINGALDNSNTSTLNPTYVTTSIPIPSSIGAYRSDATNVQDFFSGKIDAVSVWNKELSAAEITELYNSGTGKQYPN